MWIAAWVYTVYLCVKRLNKTITKFSNVKNLPLAPQYRKRLLQMSTVAARNIHNHASATCNDKRSSSLMGFETWDGWLIAGNTHNIFVMQNKLILPAYIHFKTILLFLKNFSATGEYFK